MNHLAILGPGLLGGSLALALKARAPQCRVTVWARREAAATEAAAICDLASTDLATIVRGADTVVLCVPIGAMAARPSAALVPFDQRAPQNAVERRHLAKKLATAGAQVC